MMYVCTSICAYLHTRITDNMDLGIAANLGTELFDFRTTTWDIMCKDVGHHGFKECFFTHGTSKCPFIQDKWW